MSDFVCCCASEECQVLGCKRLRDIKERVAPTMWPPLPQIPYPVAQPPIAPHGCVCPVGAESTCRGPMCPRRAIDPSSNTAWPT
jgi:hypothetical protein